MIEYKVREVKRYIVTRWEGEKQTRLEVDLNKIHGNYAVDMNMSKPSKSSQHGEFDNAETAYEVGYALAFKEREDLGWLAGDERMIFPDRYKAEG